MIKIVCVLRSGGPYDLKYVLRLRSAVRRHLSVPHAFYCLSDLNGGGPNQVPPRMIAEGIRPIRLLSDWPGWWSKMEVFKILGPVLYFDLDTVLTGHIDSLCDAVQSLNGRVLVLRGFRHGDVASGIMAWDGDMSWVTEKFVEGQHRAQFVDIKHALRMRLNGHIYRGDQDWLANLFEKMETPLVYVQDVFNGVHSYKRHIAKRQDASLLPHTRVVCFHGRPRPHELIPPPNWMREHWSC